MEVFIFNGAAGVHAATPDKSGKNLPVQNAPWRPTKATQLDAAVPLIGINVVAALADIAGQGFHLYQSGDQAETRVPRLLNANLHDAPIETAPPLPTS